MSLDLHVGWNPDLDVPAAIDRMLSTGSCSAVALVSMLDSTPGVASLPSLVPHLIESGLDYATIGEDVLVDLPTLLELTRDEDHAWFAGFDEVWICSSRPTCGKPDDVRITSDNAMTTEPDGLSAWMRSATCFLALGDGDGLNFATFDPTLAAVLRSESD